MGDEYDRGNLEAAADYLRRVMPPESVAKAAVLAEDELRKIRTTLRLYGYVTDAPAATIDTICEELAAYKEIFPKEI
jgi:hypothetical protein